MFTRKLDLTGSDKKATLIAFDICVSAGLSIAQVGDVESIEVTEIGPVVMGTIRLKSGEVIKSQTSGLRVSTLLSPDSCNRHSGQPNVFEKQAFDTVAQEQRDDPTFSVD